MKTEIRKSSELKAGDVVQCHGGRFRLSTCYHDAQRAAEYAEGQKRAALRRNDDYGYSFTPQQLQRDAEEAYAREFSCRGWHTEYLGPIYPGHDCSIPACWRSESQDWRIQGNDRALWCVEISEGAQS